MKPQMNETFRWMKNCADMSVLISVMVNGRFSHLYSQKSDRVGAMFVVTVCMLLPAVICVLVDWRVNGGIVWSDFAVGGLLLLYVLTVLPLWFKRPNPVIFVPVDFVAVGLYLLYINFATGGHWFLSFAFPVTGAIGLPELGRHPYRPMHMKPFDDYLLGHGDAERQILLNVLLTIPFGFLLPTLKRRRFLCCLGWTLMQKKKYGAQHGVARPLALPLGKQQQEEQQRHQQIRRKPQKFYHGIPPKPEASPSLGEASRMYLL